jgi:hypothetical protein
LRIEYDPFTETAEAEAAAAFIREKFPKVRLADHRPVLGGDQGLSLREVVKAGDSSPYAIRLRLIEVAAELARFRHPVPKANEIQSGLTTFEIISEAECLNEFVSGKRGQK